ncbi:VIT and VWA domain-containing protein [Gemmata sp. JC673]|uniref:VIT and VWA domain-containing protein n=1 Tax=Gemmata algarum TaxID=2975278 RepID=A0ABU5EY63_9BACT|nr:VIT and VWA domain-containing protein [Gemmata algarum]MDY3559557.1 VIT and VWA domain-containing protein [Gemmata algarum]
MRFLRFPLSVLAIAFLGATPAGAAGLLIPEDKKLPPLAMVNHKVIVVIDDQVALTTVEQTFRNYTDRNLEAIYLFPVPKGASVDRFTMWVNGKELGGELLDAKHAHKVYTDVVRRTQDPGLLEYLGNSLIKLSVFPIPPKGDQKIKLAYKFVAPKDGSVVEYVYPLKTDGKATRTLEEFSVSLNIKSRHAVQNVYSPTHAVNTVRKNDKEVNVTFERNQALLDKDFQLFYGHGDKDIGLSPLVYKPIQTEDGYFLFLISPQVEAEKKRAARDLVLVLDTSSSMSDIKMQQAKKAVKFCLSQLQPEDRFGVVRFSTTVTKFRPELVAANKDYLALATKWIDGLKTSGGTAIWPALEDALAMRSSDPSRPFTMVFFTDGQPTVDETNADKIVKNVLAKNTGNTRIFTFGVGDDVNAAMLDQLADSTRAVSTYVREAEDIEVKVSGLYAKISNPVLTDVQLTTSENVQLHEIYPPKLPDLFQGTQLVVIGRYTGQGPSVVRLTGLVGKERQQLVYEFNFPEKTESDVGKDFVEPLWARRKVGYILDQIRVNGEKKELVDEVVSVAKRYGIATPYTSHLVVPDSAMPVVSPMPVKGGVANEPASLAAPLAASGGFAPGLATGSSGKPGRVEDFAKEQAKGEKGDGKALAANRGLETERQVKDALKSLNANADPAQRARLADEIKKLAVQKKTWDDSNSALKGRERGAYQSGQLGVDLSCAANNLRNQQRVSLTANRQVQGRNCLEIGGVWIDDGFQPDTKVVTVKAHSDAYFRILEKQPQMKDVFRLGNHLVWVTPSGTALVVDLSEGQEKIEDNEIDALFVRKS